MTGQEIYDHALAVVSQQPGDNERWDALAPAWLNLILAEMINDENGLRIYNGFEPLARAPRITKLDEKIRYNERLFGALVNAMAAQLWEDAGEQYKAQDYRNRAAEELRAAQVVEPESVVNIYA